MSRSTYSTSPAWRSVWLAALGFAVCVAAFFLLVGLGLERLPFPPDNPHSDAVTSHWSNALFLRRALLDDHAFPLWRPLVMSGQPFAANPLNKVWYPPQWLVLLLPPVLHLNVLAWLHLSVAGVGAWVWGRTTGLFRWAAVLAAGGYAFAPRVIAAFGAGHLDIVYAAAWLPWLMWAVHRLTVPDGRARTGPEAGLFAALVVLADVRIGAYALALALVYGVWRWWTLRSADYGRSAGRSLRWRVLAALLLMLGLTAPLWISLLVYRADLSRGAITLADAAAGSLPPGQWAGLLFGDHGSGWEAMVYVGVSTLVLAAVTLIAQPGRFAFWWLVVLFAALYAMGDQFFLWTALNRLFPFLRWWRVPARVWLIAAWVLPYLAGWGAQLLVTDPPQRRIARLCVVALLGGGMGCGVFSTLVLAAYIAPAATVGTFALPLVALVMLLVLHRRLAAHAALAAFAAIVLLDVVWIDRTLIDARHEREWLDPYADLATYLLDAEATRVYSPSYSLPQQAAVYWRIPQFGGIDPFQLAAYVAAFEAASGTPINGYTITLPPYNLDDDDTVTDQAEVLRRANRDAHLQPELLAQWRVSHVLSAFPLAAPGLVLDTQIGDTWVYRNTTLSPSRVTWDGPNQVTVRVPAGFEGGSLYAIANGRWQDGPAPDVTPGLPGAVADAPQTWTYTYDRSEVWYGLAALAGFCALAVGTWWRAGHA